MKKKQVAVIGLGRLGYSLATTLTSLGHDVLALDWEEGSVREIASQVTHAVQADATSESVLRELGIGNFDIAIVTIGEAIEKSVLATILLKKVGVPYVIARAENELHGSILEKIGADKVFYPEQEMGVMIAHVLNLGDVIDYIPVVPGYGVLKLTVPSYFVGNTLSGVGFGMSGKSEVAVLLSERKSEIIVAPGTDEKIQTGDILIVGGNADKLEELFTKASRAKTERK